MTEQIVNTTGPRPGDRVQVEARGQVLATEVRDGMRWAMVWLQTAAGRLPGLDARVWLPVDMLVLLDAQRHELALIRRRAAYLQARIDTAPDEATTRPLADELHALLDGIDNVAELRPEPVSDES